MYSHGSSARCSVTGGYVYRGSAHPLMQGGYFFGDFCTGEIRAFAADANSVAVRRMANTSMQTSSFGEDEQGELYVVDRRGAVYRIERRPRSCPPQIRALRKRRHAREAVRRTPS